MVEVLDAGDRAVRELPRLSVVFSFRNEQANIPELLHRTRSVLRREAERGTLSGYELIFVNDASTDGSLDLLRRAADEEGDIRVVNMSRTFGHDPCVLAGMEMACGDLLVCLDTDLQDPPELISELLRVWKENPDVQVVKRRAPLAGRRISDQIVDHRAATGSRGRFRRSICRSSRAISSCDAVRGRRIGAAAGEAALFPRHDPLDRLPAARSPL